MQIRRLASQKRGIVTLPVPPATAPSHSSEPASCQPLLTWARSTSSKSAWTRSLTCFTLVAMQCYVRCLVAPCTAVWTTLTSKTKRHLALELGVWTPVLPEGRLDVVDKGHLAAIDRGGLAPEQLGIRIRRLVEHLGASVQGDLAATVRGGLVEKQLIVRVLVLSIGHLGA
eukprot:UN5058